MELLSAAESGDLDRVQVLLGQGIDPNTADSKGDTALLKAVANGHLSVVQFLTEQHGANVDIPCMTPLMMTCVRGHLKVARYLLEQGADREKANTGGWRSLHFAAIFGSLEIAMLLMSYGADLNARTNNGDLPIDVALTEEIRQAIRDEPSRRMDHGHKRATEQYQNRDVATSASAQQEDENETMLEEEKKSNKKPRLDDGVVTEEEAKILAEINEDSEPSDGEDD